jgi:hypothetical protein
MFVSDRVRYSEVDEDRTRDNLSTHLARYGTEGFATVAGLALVLQSVRTINVG